MYSQFIMLNISHHLALRFQSQHNSKIYNIKQITTRLTPINYLGTYYIKWHQNQSSSSSCLILVIFCWMGRVNAKGLKAWPSALKNLLLNYTHCRRRACKKHSIVSIPIITPIVMLKKKYIPIAMMIVLALWIPPPIVFYKKTLDSWPWAKDNAQRRR